MFSTYKRKPFVVFRTHLPSFLVFGEHDSTVYGVGNGERYRRIVRTHVTGNGQPSFGHARRSGGMHQVNSYRID